MRHCVKAGDAHGHAPPCVTFCKGALLNGSLKTVVAGSSFRERSTWPYGYGWQIFFPKFENNFEADFSRVKICDVFASRLPLGNR